MMESLERRELLSGAVDGALDPQATSENVIAADLTAPPLAAPGNLTFTKVFSTSLIIGWSDESASESGHRVDRSGDGMVWSTVGTLGPNVTSFHDTGLAPNTAYYYRVVAFDFLSELPSAVVIGTTSSQLLQLSYNDKGLSSINYNGTTLLNVAASQYDGFNIYDYKIIKPDGTSVIGRGDMVLSTSWNLDTRTLTFNYKWGSVVTQYVQDVDRLNLIITVRNKSATNTLGGVNIIPFKIQFPGFPIGYSGTDPRVGYNIDGPTVIAADWQNGVTALANDDVVKPLYVGYLTSPETSINHKYMYWVGSTPFWSQPGNWTRFDRPIVPGGTDQYTVSIRFAPTGTTGQEIGQDVYAAAQAQYPMELNWTDRRPLGYIHLANADVARSSLKNPRGYFGGTFDVRTKAGKETFRKHLMHSANKSIAVLQAMNAQGAVVWDLEGLQYPKISYVGDPRQLAVLAPEMEYRGAVDAYFKKFRDAGLKIGLSVRGHKLSLTSTGWKQINVSNPYSQLAAKIQYAYLRWGVTMFYVDSNSWKSIYDAGIFKKLLNTYPGILLMPEHQTTRYYAYTAPYQEMRVGEMSTPNSALVAYPTAFSVINPTGVNIDAYHDLLVAAVRRGDIIMFPSWYDDAMNAKIKAIYDEALANPLG